MDPDYHLKKCRDCTHRVQDTDPTNIGFKGNSHCRFGPVSLIYVSGMTPQGPMAQPIGSHYAPVTDDLGACSHFVHNGGNVRRNIVKVIPQDVVNAEKPPGLPLS